MVYLASHRESHNGQSRPGLDAILLGQAAERGLLDRLLDDASAMGRENMARMLAPAESQLERAQSAPTLPKRIAASADPAHAAIDADPDDEGSQMAGERFDGLS